MNKQLFRNLKDSIILIKNSNDDEVHDKVYDILLSNKNSNSKFNNSLDSINFASQSLNTLVNQSMTFNKEGGSQEISNRNVQSRNSRQKQLDNEPRTQQNAESYDHGFDIKNINISPHKTMRIPKNDLEKKTVSNYSEIKKKKTNRNNSYTINEQYPTESKTPKTKRTPYRGISSEETDTL